MIHCCSYPQLSVTLKCSVVRRNWCRPTAASILERASSGSKTSAFITRRFPSRVTAPQSGSLTSAKDGSGELGRGEQVARLASHASKPIRNAAKHLPRSGWNGANGALGRDREQLDRGGG